MEIQINRKIEKKCQNDVDVTEVSNDSEHYYVPIKFIICLWKNDHDLPRNEYKLSGSEFLLGKFIVDKDDWCMVNLFKHT